MIDGIVGVLGGLLLTTGLLLASVGLYGMFRRPEIFEQLHAAGLVTTPAVILILLASLATGRAEMITSAILVIAFVLVTASLSTHVIADAAWRRRSAMPRTRGSESDATGPPLVKVSPREIEPATRLNHDVPARVLVAYDGSPGAETALELVASLAWPPGSTVELVAVQDADLPALTSNAADAGTREADGRSLDARLREAGERLGHKGTSVKWRRLTGDPADAIVGHAHAAAADLVITGSRGLGYRSLVLGSVANEVIDRAPCPVLVARSSELRSVLIPTNGSAASATAIDLVARWPIFERVPVRVLSVATDEPSYSGRPGTNPIAGARAESEHQRIADMATSRLIAAGRTALPAVRAGDAAAQIVAEARSVDLIVIGSRGRTGLTRALLGSVARSVLMSSDTSVLIVRRNVGADPAEP